MDNLLEFRYPGGKFQDLSDEHQGAIEELVIAIEHTRLFRLFSQNIGKIFSRKLLGKQRLFDAFEGLSSPRLLRALLLVASDAKTTKKNSVATKNTVNN